MFVCVQDPYCLLTSYSKCQDFRLKSFKVVLTFTSYFSSVLVWCTSSLIQAVTSHAENCENLKWLLIFKKSEEKFRINVFGINLVNMFEIKYGIPDKSGF